MASEKEERKETRKEFCVIRTQGKNKERTDKMASHYKNEKAKRDGLAQLKRWKKIHMKDPVYRAVLAKKQRDRMEALKRDAEFGRIARTILQYLGAMMFDVGKTSKPVEIRYDHPEAAEILAAMKRPFSPEQATEYMELLKTKDEIERERASKARRVRTNKARKGK